MRIVSGLSLTLFWIVAATSLTACGGGGGSSGGAKNSPPPTISFAPSLLTNQADASVSSTPTGSIAITLSGLPDDGIFIGHDHTTAGITDVTLQQTSDTTGSFVVTFADPAVIGPGVYTDTISVQACLDEQCSRPLIGSPATLSVRYTVTGVQPPKPAVVLSSSAISVESLYFSNSSPRAQLAFSIQNGDAQSINLSATHTNSGIGSVALTTSGATSGAVTVFFKSPAQLGTGVYSDVITLNATCTAACPRGVDGIPQRVNVEYRVSDTVSGPEGFTVRFVAAAVNDLTWSEAHGRIYFTAPSIASANGNSVAALNPATATIETSSFVGSEPGVLSASDDGQYLYVALSGSNTIQRKTLPDLQQDTSIPLSSHPTLGAMFGNDVQPAPGQPHTIAVARRASSNFSGTAAGVVIFDDAAPRANIAGGFGAGPDINWVQWGDDTSTLYGNTSQNTSFAVSTIAVDGDGAHVISTQDNVGNASNFGRLHFSGGVLYSDGGEAYDPTTQTLLGRFVAHDVGFSRGTAPDREHNKLFMVATGSSGVELRSYNLTTFTLISSVNLGLNTTPNSYVRLIRWGEEGLAFLTDDNRIVLVNGPFVSSIAN